MKVITSPAKYFSGTVTLPSFLTFPQAIAWEKARAEADKLYEPIIVDGVEQVDDQGRALTKRRDGVTDAEYLQAWLPGIIPCVESWSIAHFDPANPPATPRAPLYELFAWLNREISALYGEPEGDPNA